VPNWHLKIIFKVVAICDRVDFVFDIADCDVIHLTQNKKTHSCTEQAVGNPERLWKEPRQLPPPRQSSLTISEKKQDDNQKCRLRNAECTKSDGRRFGSKEFVCYTILMNDAKPLSGKESFC
jgi:hypothetical protein